MNKYESGYESYSKVHLTVYTKEGKKYEGGLDSEGYEVIVENVFNISEKEFEEIQSMGQIVDKLYSWFLGTFDEIEIPRSIDFSEGDIEKITELTKKEVSRIEIDMSVGFEESFLSFEMFYDYETKEFHFFEDGYLDEWEDDNYEN